MLFTELPHVLANWRLLEVDTHLRLVAESGLKETEGFVATLAEKAPYLAGRVVVIDNQLFRKTTDGTAAALSALERLKVFYGEAVLPLEVVLALCLAMNQPGAAARLAMTLTALVLVAIFPRTVRAEPIQRENSSTARAASHLKSPALLL